MKFRERVYSNIVCVFVCVCVCVCEEEREIEREKSFLLFPSAPQQFLYNLHIFNFRSNKNLKKSLTLKNNIPIFFSF